MQEGRALIETLLLWLLLMRCWYVCSLRRHILCPVFLEVSEIVEQQLMDDDVPTPDLAKKKAVRRLVQEPDIFPRRSLISDEQDTKDEMLQKRSTSNP